jgi:hypothetical protein
MTLNQIHSDLCDAFGMLEIFIATNEFNDELIIARDKMGKAIDEMQELLNQIKVV